MNAIVLCNTESRRLKGKVFVRISGKSVLEHLLERIKSVFEKILIVAPTPIRVEGAEVVHDFMRGAGPLAALYTGLIYSESFYNFLFAADAPFASIPLAKHMMEKASGFDAVCVKIKDVVQPLFSVHSKKNASVIKMMLEEGERRLSALYPLLHTCYIGEEEAKIFDPSLLSFFSINEEEDLREARKILSSAQKL
jgi:molybdopterin-guanine dinucleotide biosynthesis protein A